MKMQASVKYHVVLWMIVAAFILPSISCIAVNEKKERITFLSRIGNLGLGFGGLTLSIAQFGTGCAIGFYIFESVKKEMDQPLYSKPACIAAAAIGLVATPTLIYAAWNTGKVGIIALNKAFSRTKKPDSVTENSSQDSAMR